MDASLWLMFVLTEGALIVTPGPAVLLVVSGALTGGRPAALRTSAGILTANALAFALSATGLGAILAASDGLYTAVRWAGAAYLIYLGARSLLRAPRRSAPVGPDPGADPTSDHGPDTGPGDFTRGLALQLSNPKAILFFVAILPQFIDAAAPVVPQILILGVTSIALEFLVLAAYGTVAAGMAARPGFATVAARVSGVLLIAIGLGLAGFLH